MARGSFEDCIPPVFAVQHYTAMAETAEQLGDGLLAGVLLRQAEKWAAKDTQRRSDPTPDE